METGQAAREFKLMSALAADTLGLSTDQSEAKNAITDFLLSKEMYYSLIGPAGSGKTTLMKSVIKDAIKRRWSVVLTAPTHKAAKQISLACDMDAYTTHKALGIKIKENNKTGSREMKASGQAIVGFDDLLIIDEAGMCGELLLKEVIRIAEKNNCKVLFVGDVAQLNPVDEPVSITVDTEAMPWSFSELTKIHRQAAKNPIIKAATAIRTSEPNNLPELTQDHNGVMGLCVMQSKRCWAELMIEQCAKFDDNRYIGYTNAAVSAASSAIRAKKYGSDVVEKNPYVNGELLVVNERYEREINGEKHTAENNTEFTVQRVHKDHDFYYVTAIIDGGFVEFRAMDSALTRKNYLSKLASEAKSSGNWKLFFQESNAIADLRSASSLTVHKSQGSTFKNVFINLDQLSYCRDAYELQRLLYVAVTRASDTVYITGDL